MSDKFEVEKGIPIPARTRAAKYPWKEMQVGDSIFVPGKSASKFGGNSSSAGTRLGFKFTVRSVDGGVRVWRIK